MGSSGDLNIVYLLDLMVGTVPEHSSDLRLRVNFKTSGLWGFSLPYDELSQFVKLAKSE
jgi:hypothetical protein